MLLINDPDPNRVFIKENLAIKLVVIGNLSEMFMIAKLTIEPTFASNI